jgi:hypothetical protein
MMPRHFVNKRRNVDFQENEFRMAQKLHTDNWSVFSPSSHMVLSPRQKGRHVFPDDRTSDGGSGRSA